MQRAGRFANLLQLDPDRWREQLLEVVLRVALVMGTIVCVPSVYMAIDAGLYGLAVADVVGLGLIYVIHFTKRLPFHVRALAFSVVFYGIGTALVFTVGIIAQIYLLGFSLIATFLLGHRFGFASVVLCSITLLAAGGHTVGTDDYVAAFPGDPGGFASWVVITLNFTLIDLALIAITSSVLATLAARFERERRALAEQRERERRVAEQAALLDKAQDAIVVLDLDGRATYLNRRAIERYRLNDGLGQDLRAHLAASVAEYDAAFDIARRDGAHTSEHRLTPADEPLVIERRWTLLRRESGEAHGVMAIDTDVTEKRRLQEQLIRSQRLESIGTLASGIAHDLNNVITPILMAADMLRVGEIDPDRLSDLATIEGSARRASDMVKQILGFARGYQGRRALIEVGPLLSDLERMMRETFPKSIDVRVTCAPDLHVIGDATQITQVLVNLCVNARDAMPRGGTLSVEVAPIELDTEAARGSFVRFCVRDTGGGMAPETLRRIYEPFFTTKEVGKGTGLGLFTSHAIVKAHQGFIWVESDLDVGTIFDVYVPMASASAEAAPRAESRLVKGRGECVLVVDDEDALRQMAQRMLELHGYEVLTACDGAQGLDVWSRHTARIQLVLTDINMPVMDGIELVASLRGASAPPKVIAMSGLPIPPELSVDAMMPKPFKASTLLGLVRQVLDR